jgi:hypothetical protein
MARSSIAVAFAGSGGSGAMTAGAVFLRAADLIIEGIRWPGFASLEVLSPCMTFRPEQKDWKRRVRPSARPVEQDRAAARSCRRWFQPRRALSRRSGAQPGPRSCGDHHRNRTRILAHVFVTLNIR